MPDDAPQPDTNKGAILVIIPTIALLAMGCVFTICWMSYTGREPGQGLTLLTGGLVGSLTSMLTKTSPTQATTFAPATTIPVQAHITNKPGDPVPTITETKI